VEKLRRACISYNIAPEPMAYQKAFNRGWKNAIEAILAGSFTEEEWFETPGERYKRCAREFRLILQRNGISTKSYTKIYGHRIRDGARLIYLGQDLDVEYWTAKKVLPSKEEAYEIISVLCSEAGFSITEYQLETRRFLKGFRKYIQQNGLERQDLIRRRWLSVSTDVDRDPINIRKQAERLVEPGRTHGLSQLDFGNRFKSLVKCFYPGGLDGLNKSLGLTRIEHIPDRVAWTGSSASSQSKARIQNLEAKIAAIHRSLQPEYLQRITNELRTLSEQAEAFDVAPTENAYASDATLENQSLEVILMLKIKDALILPEGYLYFKKWSLDERFWFKIGITNDPSRRDREQNVLPVPSETLKVVKLRSMEQARSVERVMHRVLRPRLVKGASNKEIFELTGEEYRAVARALRNLERILSDD